MNGVDRPRGCSEARGLVLERVDGQSRHAGGVKTGKQGARHLGAGPDGSVVQRRAHALLARDAGESGKRGVDRVDLDDGIELGEVEGAADGWVRVQLSGSARDSPQRALRPHALRPTVLVELRMRRYLERARRPELAQAKPVLKNAFRVRLVP